MKRIIGAGGIAVAIVAAAVGAVVLAPAANAAAGCRVVYTVQSQWPGAFTASVAITNLGDPLNGWTLRFAFPAAGQSLTQGWSATWTQSGQSVSAASLVWNSALGTNASTTIGFSGAWSGNNPVPTASSLNNVACTGSVVPTSNTPGPPFVSLISPVAGTTYIAAATIPLVAAASASGPGLAIARVEFYAGSTLLAVDTISPYSFDWQNAGGPPGSTISPTLTAKAFDNRGVSRTSARVVVTIITPVDNRRPFVAMTGPSNEPFYPAPANFNLTASASDPDTGDAVSRVEFYDGPTLLGSDTTAPYSFFYANVGPGTHPITAKAYDTRGASATSAVLALGVAAPPGNRPPTVVLTDPTNRPSYIAPVTITLDALVTEPDAGDLVNRAELYLGSTLVATQANNAGTHFIFQHNANAPASYTFTVRAHDSRGGIGVSNPLTIVVS